MRTFWTTATGFHALSHHVKQPVYLTSDFYLTSQEVTVRHHLENGKNAYEPIRARIDGERQMSPKLPWMKELNENEMLVDTYGEEVIRCRAICDIVGPKAWAPVVNKFLFTTISID